MVLAQSLMRLQLNKSGCSPLKGLRICFQVYLCDSDGGVNTSHVGLSIELLTHMMTFPKASCSRKREVQRQKLQSFTPNIGHDMSSFLLTAIDHTYSLVQCGRGLHRVMTIKRQKH